MRVPRREKPLFQRAHYDAATPRPPLPRCSAPGPHNPWVPWVRAGGTLFAQLSSEARALCLALQSIHDAGMVLARRRRLPSPAALWQKRGEQRHAAGGSLVGGRRPLSSAPPLRRGAPPRRPSRGPAGGPRRGPYELLRAAHVVHGLVVRVRRHRVQQLAVEGEPNCAPSAARPRSGGVHLRAGAIEARAREIGGEMGGWSGAVGGAARLSPVASPSSAPRSGNCRSTCGIHGVDSAAAGARPAGSGAGRGRGNDVCGRRAREASHPPPRPSRLPVLSKATPADRRAADRLSPPARPPARSGADCPRGGGAAAHEALPQEAREQLGCPFACGAPGTRIKSRGSSISAAAPRGGGSGVSRGRRPRKALTATAAERGCRREAAPLSRGRPSAYASGGSRIFMLFGTSSVRDSGGRGVRGKRDDRRLTTQQRLCCRTTEAGGQLSGGGGQVRGVSPARRYGAAACWRGPGGREARSNASRSLGTRGEAGQRRGKSGSSSALAREDARSGGDAAAKRA